MIDFSNKQGIFKDAALQETFHREGYVIVPFINKDQVQQLQALYTSIYPKGVEGFFTTTFANDVNHREKVNRSIREICKGQIEALFRDYKILFSSYIVKAPGENSELKMHQDMTLVDEKQFSGMNIWCPLVDLDAENGAIEVLPKSHRFFETYRGSSLPDIYDNVVEEIKPLMKSCRLKAGEAIIFDQSIIHYSPANLSKKERPVINTFVAHQEAKIKICYWDKDQYGDQVEIFEQEDNFLEQFENFGHNIFNRPNIGKSLGLFPFDFPKLTLEILQQEGFLPKQEKKGSTSWFKRIFSND